jgi:hypothetical protein
MRFILILAALALVAACAGDSQRVTSTGSPPAPTAMLTDVDPETATPEYVASLPHKEADDLVGDMMVHYIGLAFKRCPDQSHPMPVREACMAAQAESAFDSAGELTPLCKMHKDDSEDYAFCLIVGAENAAMVKVAGGNLASDLDWSDLDHIPNKARRVFAEFVVKKCGEDRVCFVEHSAALLGLSPQVTKSCRAHSPLVNQVFCITDAYSASVMQQAIKTASS